jgi:hypothetical protein
MHPLVKGNEGHKDHCQSTLCGIDIFTSKLATSTRALAVIRIHHAQLQSRGAVQMLELKVVQCLGNTCVSIPTQACLFLPMSLHRSSTMPTSTD